LGAPTGDARCVTGAIETAGHHEARKRGVAITELLGRGVIGAHPMAARSGEMAARS